MSNSKVTIEVRWNFGRSRYDVRRGGTFTYFGRSKASAVACARRIGRDLMATGGEAEVVVVQPSGFRIPEKL